MRWRFDLRHPSTTRLREWLETGEPAGVGEHVEQCERCANRLEHIDGDESIAPSLEPTAPLRQALSAALSPPDDLNERVLRGVARRSRVDEELRLFAGLLSIGIETARLMIETDVDQDRNHDERRNGDGSASSDEEDDPR